MDLCSIVSSILYVRLGNVYVQQISFDVQVHIQSVTWHFPKTRNGCRLTSTFSSKMSPQCHILPSNMLFQFLTCQLTCGFSLVKSHTTCQILSCAYAFCVCQMSKTCKNFVKNARQGYVYIDLVMGLRLLPLFQKAPKNMILYNAQLTKRIEEFPCCLFVFRKSKYPWCPSP